jgi:hypothetical protein
MKPTNIDIMKKVIIIILLGLPLFSMAQNSTINMTGPISGNAYDRKVLKDLNFIILGDNNIKSGLTYKLSETKSELELSGKIFTVYNGIGVLKGKFGTDNGNYIFDNKDGAKKGELSLSYFLPVNKVNKSFYSTSDVKSQRIILKIAEERIRWNNQIKLQDSINYYEFIAYRLQIPYENTAPAMPPAFPPVMGPAPFMFNGWPLTNDSTLREILKKYVPKDDLLGETSIATLNTFIAGDLLLGGYTKVTYRDASNTQQQMPLYEKFNTKKFVKDYEALLARRENQIENLAESEIVAAQNIWTLRKLGYLGVYFNYKRESFTSFSPVANFTAFNKMFTDQLGDLFDFGFSYNYLIQSKKTFAFFKAFVSGGRLSNLSDFKATTLNYEVRTSLTDADGIALMNSNTKVAYINKTGANYDYSFGIDPGVELYGGFNSFGLYSRLEFKEARQHGQTLSKSIPFEIGTFMTVKSDKKDLLTVSIFVNRHDLNVHPDNDLNFGFKVGLPFNFNTNL